MTSTAWIADQYSFCNFCFDRPVRSAFKILRVKKMIAFLGLFAVLSASSQTASLSALGYGTETGLF